MNSELLNKIGLGNLDIGYILIGMLVLLIIMLIISIAAIKQVGALKNRIGTFMKGKDAKSLESDIVSIKEVNEYLTTSTEQNQKDIRKIYRNLAITYQKIGIVKYDAFKEMGGKLSFSLALLNDKNDGFILNSVHSSDGCYSYTKEITGGECKIDLSAEEQKALDMAMHAKENKQA